MDLCENICVNFGGFVLLYVACMYLCVFEYVVF